jgi:hypothetical protein
MGLVDWMGSDGMIERVDLHLTAAGNIFHPPNTTLTHYMQQNEKARVFPFLFRFSVL